MSSPVTAAGIAPGSGAATPARHFTEPYRQLGALALLTANAVFLFLGLSGLVFVIDGWGSGFGARSAAEFGAFVGPLSLGLPFAAMLLATHVVPMVPRSRAILLTVLIQYGVSAGLGVITFLGAFAHDLFSVRATLEGSLGRAVWLALLVLAVIVVYRVLVGLYPPAPPRVRPAYAPGSPVYGRPYPGQPVYPPAAGYPATTGAAPAEGVYHPPPVSSTYDDALFEQPTTEGGWPVVPPPPLPLPLSLPTQASPEPAPTGPTSPPAPVVEPDPTVRVTPLTTPLNGEATRLLPLNPPGEDRKPEIPHQQEHPDGASEPPTER
jgi:hypothetical protein